MDDITPLIDLPEYDPNTSCPTGSGVVVFDAADLVIPPLDSVEITRVFLPLTLPELVKRERLTRTQASRVRDGLRWAQRFGLIRHEPWEHYRFDIGDVKTALVLSIIVEAARRSR